MKDLKKRGIRSGKLKKETTKYTTKRFKLLGIKVVVKYVKEIKAEDGYKLGETVWSGDTATISIALNGVDGPLSEECMKRTLLHELVHLSFGTLYYDTENNDEHLVEWLSACFYEYLQHKLI